MKLGATLDPGQRTWLNQLALDLAFHGLLPRRLEHLHAGRFPGRVEADVVVKWGPRRVPFRDVRRIDDSDYRSLLGWGSGRLGAILEGLAEIEAVPGKVGWPAEIDPELAQRMPEPSLQAPPLTETPSMAIISRPLVTLALEGPLFRRLREGVDVPPSPLRRNLETEVRLHGPDGAVPWNKARLISDAEMTALGVEFANRAYTLLLGVAEGRIGIVPPKPGEPRPEEFEPGLL